MGELRWIGRLHSGAQDAVEQIGSDAAIGERRNRTARLGQVCICWRIEQRTSAARCIHPPRKRFGWHSLEVETHIGETVAAELGRQPRIRSGMVDLTLKA